MHIKALTATVIVAVFAGVFLPTAHAKALSPTTTSASNTSSSVTVAPGDSLALIAGKNGTTYERLYDANPQIKDPNLIYPGEVIQIPTAGEQLPDRLGAVDPAPTTQASYEQSAVPVVAIHVAATPSGGVWARIADCESGGNWSSNTGNGFYGGLQFTLSSWRAVGGTGYPSQASESEQVARAQILQAKQGWGAWPVCSAKAGL